MQIGPYEIHTLETGTFGLDGGAMFGVVPRPLWEKSNPPDDRNRIAMAARALLIRGMGRTILVDTGNGEKYDEKLKTIYKFDTGRSNLIASLARHNVAPSDVTDVILTHLHFDHAGGSTILQNGEAVPTFAGARHYVQRAHWEAALHPTERDRASFFPADFRPLQERNLLEFAEGEAALFPGIHLRVFHGHTIALQCPVISDGVKTMFYCADLIPTASHVQLPWIMAYDLRPLVTLEEKRGILKTAVDEGWIMVFEHDPAHAAGHVTWGEKGFRFESPMEI